MSQRPSMLLDSNAFIEPKNRFYAFDICPGFWDFVVDDFAKGNAMSIVHVRDEILNGGDELGTWMKNKLDKVCFYDCAADGKILPEQLRVANYVMSACKKPHLVKDFLGSGIADPWIVAYALTYGATVVTQEKHRSMNKKVSLFDVCDHFGIPHIDIFEFLRVEKARFVYEKHAGC